VQCERTRRRTGIVGSNSVAVAVGLVAIARLCVCVCTVFFYYFYYYSDYVRAYAFFKKRKIKKKKSLTKRRVIGVRHGGVRDKFRRDRTCSACARVHERRATPPHCRRRSRSGADERACGEVYGAGGRG